MSAPRAVVLRAAGSNCDRETGHALQLAGAAPELVHVNRLLEQGAAALQDVEILAIPGGFTYGDDLGAGRILGSLLQRRLADAIRRLVDRGGLVIGICNGFQVLVQSGLLPGGEGRASLARNDSGRFEARWARLQVCTDRSPWLTQGDVLDLPVAHAEGRLVPDGDGTLVRLQEAGQVALRYLKPSDGMPGVAGSAGRRPAGYPANPAGSTDDIAGLIDPSGRILGLMPHPERNVAPWHRPGWTRGQGSGASGANVGLRLFQAAVAHLRRELVEQHEGTR